MRHGLVELSFKVHRGLVSEGAVEPLSVVKKLVPLTDRSPCRKARGEQVAMDWNRAKGDDPASWWGNTINTPSR